MKTFSVKAASAIATTLSSTGVIAFAATTVMSNNDGGQGHQSRKSSSRIEVSKPEQAFYACVDAFVYWHDLSYKKDSFWYKTTLDATSTTQETDPSTAKDFFDQKVQDDCLKQWTEVKKTNPKISDELFNSYETDKDFWLKKWSLPTTKQQRALNELTHAQLDCIKTTAHQFTINSNTNFMYQDTPKPIDEFEKLFTSTATSCGAPEEKIIKIIQTYTPENNSPQKAVMYFYLISYLTTNLSPRQELFQKIKVTEWLPNNSTCDDFSSHINKVLDSTFITLDKWLYIGSRSYGKRKFKEDWIKEIKKYNKCQPYDLTETNSNLKNLFNEYYVEDKGLTQLTQTTRHKIITQQERRAGVVVTKDDKGVYRTKKYIVIKPEEGLDNTDFPTPTSTCKQKYCSFFWQEINGHVWFDQNNSPVFYPSTANDLTLWQTIDPSTITETLIDIELFIEDYVFL